MHEWSYSGPGPIWESSEAILALCIPFTPAIRGISVSHVLKSAQLDSSGLDGSTASPRTLRTLEKGLKLLSLFDIDHQEWTLRELREATGESKTNIFRVVTTLEKVGYLVRDTDTRKLRLGPSITRLSYVTLSHAEIVRAAVDPMRRLYERVKEMLDLVVEIELGALMSLYDMTPRPYRIPPSVGRIGLPGLTTAASKVMVAFRAEEQWDDILTQIIRPFTEHSVLDFEQLREQLKRIRSDGVAFERGENSIELCGVAAPIFGHEGDVRACLSIVSPVEQTTMERMYEQADAVRETAAEISQELGAPVEQVAFLRNCWS